MFKILILILLILMILVGGKRGFKSFISLCLNFILLIITFYLVSKGLNPIIVSLIGCGIISYIIIFFVNGENVKTNSSMLSVIIVLVILAFLIIGVSNISKIGGFGHESFEEINMFSYDINFNMNDVTIALILIGLIGATIDTSIAISSSLYEVYVNNKNLTKKELFKSGINVGKDILCTTTNTLLFAFLGEFMTLIIWFKTCNYSLGDIVNAKVFTSEFIKIMFSGLGCIIIIPITSYITSHFITHTDEEELIKK